MYMDAIASAQAGDPSAKAFLTYLKKVQ